MNSEALILAIDQGTTGSTAVVMDLQGAALSRATVEFPQHFPKPGWVEHDPDELWHSVLDALTRALDKVPGCREKIVAIGIANQRETMLVWDGKSGRPVHRALVWQDRRSSTRCLELKGLEERVREVTGLVIDPYFSASKLEWLLKSDRKLYQAAREGKVSFGTIDSYLVERLRGGPSPSLGGAVIEATNASRTLLMDLRTRVWSEEMCNIWGIPKEILPRIVPSAGEVARSKGVPGLPDGIPITGVAGDQHAALFGQGCIHEGDIKCTYGTGAFVLANTGKSPLRSQAGMLTTLAWQVGDEAVYALEGSVFVAGAAVQWLRDGLGIIKEAAEVEDLAASVDSTEGITFVPALAGLGAPYWDPEARGLLCGMTRGTHAGHIARATLEAIAFQVDDLIVNMRRDLSEQKGSSLGRLKVDGGASRNNLLLQMQADISDLMVERPMEVETTARGAALLAAVGAGLLPDVNAAASAFQLDKQFSSAMTTRERRESRHRWEEAIARVRCHL